MIKIKIVKPKVWNFKVIKGKDAWKEVVYSARMSGIPPEIEGRKAFLMMVHNDYSSILEHILIKFDMKFNKGSAPDFLEHRISSHTGYSTRFIKVSLGMKKKQPSYEIIMPWHLLKRKDNDPLKKLFLESVQKGIEAYDKLLSEGIPKDSARYALPFCQAVAIYHVTFNLRSLLNFFSLRLCVRASPEMRSLASQMYFNLIKQFPIMRGLVGCRGFIRGTCPESDVTGVRVGKAHSSYPVCPFKNQNLDFYIPTFKDLRTGLSVKKFNKEKAVEVQEIIFKKWANWEG